ncbi:Formylglycine-generating sulfatase enzyme [Planctomycetales bacterium 10988]|nr:Formylglycine-generating sulfatase enzyme [Planctomycetales bacterium 10988]
MAFSRFSLALFGAAMFSLPLASLQAELPEGIVAEEPTTGRFVKVDEGYMVPYETTIPGTDVVFEMVPIPGGTCKIGSPSTEPGRSEVEGPQFEVVVKPFWMGKYEITWAEYEAYMAIYDVFKSFEALDMRTVTDDKKVDAITAPTKLYDPSTTYQNGDDDKLPAVTMTQYSAKQYTKWLSLLKGQYFRLPSEAEWEYACRAGTTTPFYFGDDAEKLEENGYYYENGDYTTHLVGEKKPNPWGLYDMAGNVGEWTLDAYTEDGYLEFAGKTLTVEEAVKWPKSLYPRVIRGGWFDADASDCRSASRMPSEDEDWKIDDPNFPLSPWWFTTEPATGIGFRILRPLDKPSEKMKRLAWEMDVDSVKEDVGDRLDEGRGAEGYVDQALPKDIETMKEKLRGR